MENAQYDLIVIGSGPAGQKGAIAAAKLGKKVAVIDRKGMIGGVSLHEGTIPSKTLREAVLYLSGLKQRPFYGRDYALKEEINREDLAKRVRIVVENEMEVVRDQLLRNDIDLVHGTGSFLGEHQVRVETPEETVTLTGEKILIACGSRPARPADVPFDEESILDVEQLLQLQRLPDKAIIIGGGAIGLEFASMFAAIDIEVTIIDRGTELLDFVDQEIMERLQYHLRDLNVVFRLGENVADLNNAGNEVIVNLESGKRVKGDILLYAVGRTGNADRLNLESTGLTADESGRLGVNERFQTPVSHIYAAGDVIGFPGLTSTSMEQGRLAANYMFDIAPDPETPLLPYGIYTIPEIAMVGKTEQQLTEEKVPYEFGIARYDELAKGQLTGARTGVVKLLFDPDSHDLLGIHILGESATELIHIGQTVLAMDGTIEYFRDSVFNYPTFAEAYKVAALDGLNKV